MPSKHRAVCSTCGHDRHDGGVCATPIFKPVFSDCDYELLDGICRCVALKVMSESDDSERRYSPWLAQCWEQTYG